MKWALIILSGLVIYSETCRVPFTTEQVSAAHVRHVVDSMITYHQDLFAPSAVDLFYTRRDHTLAWLRYGYLTGAGDSLMKEIRQSRYLGLIPDEYHLAEMDSSLSAGTMTPASQIRLDVLLTDAFVKLATHTHFGRLHAGSGKLNNRTEITDTALVQALQRCAVTGSFRSEIARAEPTTLPYSRLKERLASQLSREEESMLDAYALQDLEAHILRTAVNLERWRWMGKLPDRYLMVNIPAFVLNVVEHGRTVLSSRIVVGLPEKPTPLLSSEIECMIVYPYWHVPRSIATKELLPLIRRDSGYLTRNRFEVLDSKNNVVDAKKLAWERFDEDYFPYRLRQREGSDNALGIVKFQFENAYGVYLHDTNAKRYFNKQNRALSHGCVRVEKAIELAHYLVRYDSGRVTEAMLDHYLGGRKRLDIPVKKKLPVIVQYFTVDEGGEYADIYQLDQPILMTLQGFIHRHTTDQSYFVRLVSTEDRQ